MSEMPGIVVSVSLDSKYGSLGSLAPNIAIKIIDPDSGKICGQNEVGEICIKTPFHMLGYLNRPQANQEFFGSDNFLHSGDLGFYDSNFQLHFTGRLKELIKYKNIHISPLGTFHKPLGHNMVLFEYFTIFDPFKSIFHQFLTTFQPFLPIFDQREPFLTFSRPLLTFKSPLGL